MVVLKLEIWHYLWTYYCNFVYSHIIFIIGSSKKVARLSKGLLLLKCTSRQMKMMISTGATLIRRLNDKEVKVESWRLRIKCLLIRFTIKPLK